MSFPCKRQALQALFCRLFHVAANRCSWRCTWWNERRHSSHDSASTADNINEYKRAPTAELKIKNLTVQCNIV